MTLCAISNQTNVVCRGQREEKGSRPDPWSAVPASRPLSPGLPAAAQGKVSRQRRQRQAPRSKGQGSQGRQIDSSPAVSSVSTEPAFVTMNHVNGHQCNAIKNSCSKTVPKPVAISQVESTDLPTSDNVTRLPKVKFCPNFVSTVSTKLRPCDQRKSILKVTRPSSYVCQPAKNNVPESRLSPVSTSQLCAMKTRPCLAVVTPVTNRTDNYDDRRLLPHILTSIEQLAGVKITEDLTCNADGSNAHTSTFRSPRQSFLEHWMREGVGLLNPPYSLLHECVEHFIAMKLLAPAIGGLLVLPCYNYPTSWDHLTKHFELLTSYAAHSTELFDQCHDTTRRCCIMATRDDVC